MANAPTLVRDALRDFAARVPDLFAPGTRLVVGFSGGQDSTCLLHALHVRFPDLDLFAAHVDHGLRPDSASSAQRAVDLAQSVGVPAHVVRVDIARGKRSLQDAARAARYKALAEVVRQHQARALLVAHTLDDQAETVLLNLLRGASLRGLAGMRPDTLLQNVTQQVRVARPLLRIDRATTQAYCASFGLPVVEDPSNQSRAYTRNRVRLDLLPVLESFNPAIRSVLSRAADLAADDVAALDDIVDALHSQLARPRGEHAIAYDLRAWRAQPRALQRRLLRRGMACLLSTLHDVPAQPVEDAIDLLRSAQRGQTYHLPYGVELAITDDAFELRRFGAARRRNNQGPHPSRV